ncbi:hypothetical protein YIM730264_20350 [Thermus hydrothermalis]
MEELIGEEVLLPFPLDGIEDFPFPLLPVQHGSPFPALRVVFHGDGALGGQEGHHLPFSREGVNGGLLAQTPVKGPGHGVRIV